MLAIIIKNIIIYNLIICLSIKLNKFWNALNYQDLKTVKQKVEKFMPGKLLYFWGSIFSLV